MTIEDILNENDQAAYSEATGCYHRTLDNARRHAQRAADVSGEAMEITLAPVGDGHRYSVDPNPTRIMSVVPLVQHIEFVEPR